MLYWHAIFGILYWHAILAYYIDIYIYTHTHTYVSYIIQLIITFATVNFKRPIQHTVSSHVATVNTATLMHVLIERNGGYVPVIDGEF